MQQSIDTGLMLESYFLPDRLDKAVYLLDKIRHPEANAIIAQHQIEVEPITGKLDVDLERFKELLGSEEVRKRLDACQNRTEAAE